MRAAVRVIAVLPFVLVLSALRAAAVDDALYKQEIDVVIADAHGLAVPMDIFVPTGDRNALGIVDVAAGAWHSDRGKIRDHERAKFYDILCGRGYTVFAVRPGSISRFNAADMVGNIETAIRWVKERAQTYGINPERVGLTGASAGGHLASLVGIKTSRPGDDSARVAAVAVFFPPTDFLNFAGNMVDPRGESRLGKIAARLAFAEGLEDLSEEQITEKLASISPARQVHSGAPPFLLIHGDADPVVPLQQSEVLRDALQSANVPVTLIIKPDGAHPWPTIPEEVAKLADWFDERLKVPAPGEAR
jgi:acetyl esterase/lipase